MVMERSVEDTCSVDDTATTASSLDYYSNSLSLEKGPDAFGKAEILRRQRQTKKHQSIEMSLMEQELREVVRDLELDLEDALRSRKEAIDEVDHLQGLLHEISAENDELVNDMQMLMDDNDDLKKGLDEGLQREKQFGLDLEKAREDLFLCQEELENHRAKPRASKDEIAEAVKHAKQSMERKLRQSNNERQELERIVEQMSEEIEVMRDQMLSILAEKKTTHRRMKALQEITKPCSSCRESFLRLEADGSVPKDTPRDRKGPNKRASGIANLRRIIAPVGVVGGSGNRRGQGRGSDDSGKMFKSSGDLDIEEPSVRSSSDILDSMSQSNDGKSGSFSNTHELPSVNEDFSQRELRLPNEFDDQESGDEPEIGKGGRRGRARAHSGRGGNLFGRNKRQGRHSTGCLHEELHNSGHLTDDDVPSVVSGLTTHSNGSGRRRPNFNVFGNRRGSQDFTYVHDTTDPEMMAAIARAREIGAFDAPGAIDGQSVLSGSQCADEDADTKSAVSANSFNGLKRRIRKNGKQTNEKEIIPRRRGSQRSSQDDFDDSSLEGESRFSGAHEEKSHASAPSRVGGGKRLQGLGNALRRQPSQLRVQRENQVRSGEENKER